ncbi:SGNH/GDSL hydrolase family protein [Haloterrigena salifodinae]|uniref:SGNH/GDSL hydrolase family protein n=1 Tax=Haloterrigena salifodinae TaxID=2675099 RepID=A0A8T8E7M6_9EURY|nr:SGNH/GDSL hydrolase family protein [Haloterrigena salifodinae]QRV17719.1 SGNH/GDSL hydrolase family protein [Haloterrigena salifodinae]
MTGSTRRETLKSLGAVSGLVLGGTGADVLTGDSPTDTERPPGRSGTEFVGTWTASPMAPNDEGLSQEGFEDETLRLMVRTSVGGNGVRIRLSNTFGDEPVTFERASVGIRAESGSATIEPGTLRQLTFGGDDDVTITAGGRVLSDPVDLHVEPEQDLAVNLYAAAPTGPTTLHHLETKTSFVAESGDHTDETGADAFTTEISQWFYLDGVEVVSPETNGAIVCLGDSITDGFESTYDANATYPDFLAERINESGSLQKSVLNAGIAANRVLSKGAGENALARFDRDVIAQTGVTDVLLLEGINDIGAGTGAGSETLTAEDLIDGYQQLIRRAHAKGLRIIGGTLTPMKDNPHYTPEGEEIRQTVNEFIRTSDAFDGVVDFDEAIRDPDNPERMLPKYDSGDNLHPGDVGYEAMAEAVDLSLFRGRGRNGGKGHGKNEGRGGSPGKAD